MNVDIRSLLNLKRSLGEPALFGSKGPIGQTADTYGYVQSVRQGADAAGSDRYLGSRVALNAPTFT
jgi:hypothetical protein